VDNIKMDFGKIRWGGVDWIGLALDKDKWRALANAVIDLWVLLNAGMFLNGCTTGCLSSSGQSIELVNYLLVSYLLLPTKFYMGFKMNMSIP
jgi:hypothetical protein